MALPVLLGLWANSATLIEESLVMRHMAWWGDAILLRAWGTTLSSAIGSILGALASTCVVVDIDDIRGGVGANFILRWHAERPVSPPVVETVMITGASTQGISLRSTAYVLREDRADSSSTDR